MSRQRGVLLVLLWLSSSPACRHDARDTHAAPATASAKTPPPAPAAPKVSAVLPPTAAAPSVYDLAAKLEDQTGATLPLDAFRGRPVVLTMFYSGCKAMCPLLITHLKAIEDALPKPALAQTRFLMVSFDSERDTPQKLTALAEAHAIDTKRWTLTRTSASSVQELAAVLDIRYRQLPSGEFVHSSIITVLDESGVPLWRGEDSDATAPEQVEKAIAKAIAAR